MANEQNLMPIEEVNSRRTPEQHSEDSRKAGIASGESRRRTKTFREAMMAILNGSGGSEEQKAALEALGLEPTYRNLISLANIIKAAAGDSTATALVRDTVGEKPRDGLEIGNLDDKPLACLDMSKLTDEQLRVIAAKKSTAENCADEGSGV